MHRALSIRTVPALLAVPAALSLVLASGGIARAATAPGASADAYGALVDAQLLAQNVPVKAGPISQASQEYPPGATQPAGAQVVSVGPVPDDGSLVKHVGVITALAGATGTPEARASAETADVSLLADAKGVPAVSADLVRAQANSDCTKAPNATGTTFVNLVIGGQPFEGSPDPNTVIDLQLARVILNEQHPAADGRGIVVNAIHVVSTTTGDPLFRGDIVVSHAMSTVSCPNGAGSTGGNNLIKIEKTVSPETAAPGDTLTYSVTVANSSTEDCLVNRAIDHLPAGFTFVSTSGDLGSALDVSPPEARPGGGLELVVGNGKTIAAGKSAHQVFVVKVGEHQAPGVYYNNVELFCANLGDYVKGLDAPVTVTGPPSTTPPTTPPTTPVTGPPTFGSGPPPVLARTGGLPAALPGLVLLSALGAALAARRALGAPG
jgi:uncharacterized repeat protein (TIGR01451 family)